MLKRLITIILALTLVSGIAAAEGRLFSGRGLGMDISISDDWYGSDQAQNVGFWRRTDENVVTDELFGYGMLYVIPDYSAIPQLPTRDETEKWLNENCVPVGGVITHRAGFDTSGIYPDFDRRELDPAGETHFTVIFPKSINTDGLDANVAQIAERVFEGLKDDSRYLTYDITADYGYLGQFSATSLAGNLIDNDYVSDSDLTIVYFWATYCSPCISTMKKFSDVVEKYSDQNVRALGVVLDVRNDNADGLDLAKTIVENKGVTFENIPAALPTETMMTVEATPSYAFISPDGELLEMIVGARTEDQYAQLIEKYLNN